MIPWSVLAFESRGDMMVERVFVDPSNQKMTVTSRLSADRSNKYFTALATGSGIDTGTPFSDVRAYRFYITPASFQNAMIACRNAGSNASVNPADYVLNSFGLVMEQALQEGDGSEMAATIDRCGLFEVDGEYYVSNVSNWGPLKVALAEPAPAPVPAPAGAMIPVVALGGLPAASSVDAGTAYTVQATTGLVKLVVASGGTWHEVGSG